MPISAGMGRAIGGAFRDAISRSRSGPGSEGRNRPRRGDVFGGVVGGVMGLGGSGSPSRGGGFRPGANPELGGSGTRRQQAEAIDAAFGSPLAAFSRGDFLGGLTAVRREIGELLGFEEELDNDKDLGFGTRVTLKPFQALSLLPPLMAISAAPAVLAALGPASAAQAVMQGFSQGQTISQISSMGPRVDLGFRPTSGTVARAQAKVAAGATLTARDQLAAEFARRERERQADLQQGRGGDRDRGDPRRTIGSVLSPFLATPSLAPPKAAPEADSSARLLAGRDPRLGVDVLRTAEEAKVAAGLAPRKPTVRSVFQPSLPGALI